MSKVRMANVCFPSIYLADVPEDIAALIDCDRLCSYGHRWTIPVRYKENRPDNYDTLCATDDFIKENPLVESQTISMQYEKYIDLSFKYRKRLILSIQQFYEIEIEDTVSGITLATIEQHTKLLQKQYEQLLEFSNHTFNEKCGVSITNDFMINVNQTMLLEDACTDYLQECLSLGWRIISVTPQPNQRRPDYVLGKVADKPKTKALRGYENE